MKKLLLCLSGIAMAASPLFAQKGGMIKIGKTFRVKPQENLLNRTAAPGCDTVNIPFPAAWDMTAYYSSSQGTINGFITGNNAYGDQEKAAYFNVSNTSNTYLTKVWIAFAVANSSSASNLTKNIPIKVYDGTSGTPGTLLTSVNKTLSSIKTDVDAGNFTEVVFPTAITLPASKKFFVSVDVSGLVWTSNTRDSLAIYSSDADEVTAGQNGFGYEKYNNSWGTFDDGWGANFGLYIHPFISTNTACALATPVTLTSFTGKKNGKSHVISWSTANELNNAGFELERSADAVTFSSISRINSKGNNGNSSAALQYNYTDAIPLKGANYYRLKQIDRDGKTAYSSIVNLKGEKVNNLELNVLYPNPATSLLNLSVATPDSRKVTILVTDLAGRTVLTEVKQLVSGDNNIQVPVNKLSSGTYLVKILCDNGCETISSKFIRQ